MIKNIKTRISCDPRGKITTGMKSEKGYPKTTDYFVISDFPELELSYGREPKKLVLYFPSDNIEDFFDCDYKHYGKDTLLRKCDSEICLHRIDEVVNGISYKAGDESECVCKSLAEKDKTRCKYVAYLRAWVVDIKLQKVNNPLCYLFQTGSKNSGDTIYSELQKIKDLNMGVLRGIPFGLSVKMVGGKTDAKTKFPIWSLQAIGLINDLQLRTSNNLEMPKRKQLAEVVENPEVK